MIILVTGDFCVGKDTVADILVDKLDANKILSYTTRKPRYEGEDTHEFCTRQEFEQFDDVVAFTEIGGALYGSRRSQFIDDEINIYVVDHKGVVDMLDGDLGDDVFVLEVVRPSWLIECPAQRSDRDRKYDVKPTRIDYRLINDGDMEKLYRDCTEFLAYLQSY